ncbi:hypothetical protein DOTSEDRAFT_74688 [Dothistroma septosporum NZE10]|uniref:BTB domain-containing protein n=1 Tax=Dothistroma septosporum (strain NZE10 / CBS 128990) TaxID=675120 RepID=N1PF10_DOTSN|nr:hypothetical protein DOTSEDRAFT_74688 [Dothistroma septosporum NZE10]
MPFSPFPITNRAHGFATLLQSEHIDVVVGSGDSIEVYPVPKPILIARSERFATCLKDGNCLESQGNKVPLPMGKVGITPIACKLFASGCITIHCHMLSTVSPCYADFMAVRLLIALQW